MFIYILAEPNLPFAVALAILLIIAIMEGVGALFGAGISAILESALPDLDIPDIDGPEIDNPSTLVKVFSWIRVGELPVLVLLIIFLLGFSLTGLFIQGTLQETMGFMLPYYLAMILAFLIAWPFTRLVGGLVARIMPKDETQAISQKAFIGREAVISLGTASHGNPAQGKIIDQFGTSHYIMIEPDDPVDHFDQGTEVRIVSKSGSIFKAINNAPERVQAS